jgi:hypothetical protein
VAGVAHGLAAAAVADAGAFLARLTRLDANGLVRLRPAGPDRTALWARLPWEAIVTRSVPGTLAGDVTVRAAELLAELERGGTGLPARRDELWRWPLPPARVQVLEQIPAAVVRQIGAAAEGTVRTAARTGAGGRPVGERAVRDALLDHIAIRVTPDPPSDSGRKTQAGGQGSGRDALAGGEGSGRDAPAGGEGTVDVPQRLVQAVVRMGFLGRDPAAGQVRVLRAGAWVGLAAPYGTAWLPPAGGLILPRRL